MNTIERMLADELTRLMDRLAASVPESTLHDARTSLPTLRARLDEVDRRLAGEYAALSEAYGRWQRTLEDLENLWALAAWRSAVADEPAPASMRQAA